MDREVSGLLWSRVNHVAFTELAEREQVVQVRGRLQVGGKTYCLFDATFSGVILLL